MVIMNQLKNGGTTLLGLLIYSRLYDLVWGHLIEYYVSMCLFPFIDDVSCFNMVEKWSMIYPYSI